MSSGILADIDEITEKLANIRTAVTAREKEVDAMVTKYDASIKELSMARAKLQDESCDADRRIYSLREKLTSARCALLMAIAAIVVLTLGAGVFYG